MLCDVVVEAPEAGVLVLAAVEAELGVELVLLAAVAAALLVEPSGATGAVRMPTGASVGLA